MTAVFDLFLSDLWRGERLFFDDGLLNFHAEVAGGVFGVGEDEVAGFEGDDGYGGAVGADESDGFGVL